MNKNLQNFGAKLKKIRIEQGLSLREICRITNYDPSNWSKVERGVISPPSDEKVLSKWAKALRLKQNTKEFQRFIDEARIAQGIIPQDILAGNNAIDFLPAVFRTLRNEKPSKEEIDQLIQLIRNS
jgi:transcriptional regulator with XRE-family HTH domain